MRFVAVCSLVALATAGPQEADPNPLEETETVRAEFDGLLEPHRTIDLSAAVDGLLETVSVDRGDTVKKGQIVATLESSVEMSALKIAKARSEMVGALKRQQANLKYLRNKLVQDEDLFKRGIISEQEIEESRTTTLLADAAVLEEEEKLRLAKLEYERSEAALALRTVRSPIDGVVVERLLSPGELVTEAREAQIIRLAQIDPLRVQVILPVSWRNQVKVGTKAEVRPEAPFAGFRTAEVTVVDQVVDAASGTFEVRLEIPNADNQLPAGLKCRVRFAR